MRQRMTNGREALKQLLSDPELRQAMGSSPDAVMLSNTIALADQANKLAQMPYTKRPVESVADSQECTRLSKSRLTMLACIALLPAFSSAPAIACFLVIKSASACASG